jgi:hypothetical protein
LGSGFARERADGMDNLFRIEHYSEEWEVYVGRDVFVPIAPRFSGGEIASLIEPVGNREPLSSLRMHAAIQAR